MARRTTRKGFILKLGRLKPAVRRHIEKAIELNARDVRDLAASFAARSSDTGDLVRSIRAVSYTSGRATRWRVIAGDEKAFYARWVEFGTAAREGHPGTAPQPFFFVAYRALRKRLRGRLTRAFTKAKKEIFG